jgi:nickel transport protein
MNRRAVTVLMAIVAALSALLLPPEASAHGVSVYAWQEGGTVRAEAYFADGARCIGCGFEVRDPGTGELLLEGKTDGQGAFSFEAPGGDVRVVVRAGPGHMGEYVLSGKDSAPEAARPTGAGGEESFDEEEARRKIEDLTSEVRRLRREAERPGLAEIVGGIGWIVGILGALAYLKGRKKAK